MPNEINVTQRTQRIHVTPSSKAVSTENAGPIGPAGIGFVQGSGSPEGVVTASPGTAYLNTSGGAGTTLYVKESGTGNTGWVAK